MIKEGLIQQIFDEGLFHMDAPLVISNGLGTQILFFPKDAKNPRVVEREIDEAMGRSFTPIDEGALNLLRDLFGGQGLKTNVGALALYLAMADEVSIQGAPLEERKTILSILRAANATLVKDATYDLEFEKQKVQQALHETNLQSCVNMFSDWCEKGTFTALGEPQGIYFGDDTLTLEGRYMQLARALTRNFFYPNANDYISFALGNRLVNSRHGYADEAQCREQYKQALGESLSSAGARELRIETGYAERRRRLEEAIVDKTSGLSCEHEPHVFPAAQEILQFLPEPLLQYILKRKIAIAYTDTDSIAPIYPTGMSDLLNLHPKTINAHQASVGLRESFNRVIFLSRGDRQNFGQSTDEEKAEIYARRVAQCLVHELFHDVYAQVPENEKRNLETKLQKISSQQGLLQQLGTQSIAENNQVQETAERLSTISTATLGTVLDPRSNLYRGYAPRHVPEEIFCNLAGLMYAEKDFRITWAIQELLDDIKALFERLVAASVGMNR